MAWVSASRADGHRRGVRCHLDDVHGRLDAVREIATLRALGFNTGSVLVSVLSESLALAAIGGAIGGVLAYVAFNGYQTSTMNFSTFSQVAFAFQVTPQLLGMGLTYALIHGAHRRTLPGRSRSASAYPVRAQRVIRLS